MTRGPRCTATDRSQRVGCASSRGFDRVDAGAGADDAGGAGRAAVQARHDGTGVSGGTGRAGGVVAPGSTNWGSASRFADPWPLAVRAANPETVVSKRVSCRGRPRPPICATRSRSIPGSTGSGGRSPERPGRIGTGMAGAAPRSAPRVASAGEPVPQPEPWEARRHPARTQDEGPGTSSSDAPAPLHLRSPAFEVPHATTQPTNAPVRQHPAWLPEPTGSDPSDP